MCGFVTRLPILFLVLPQMQLGSGCSLTKGTAMKSGMSKDDQGDTCWHKLCLYSLPMEPCWYIHAAPVHGSAYMQGQPKSQLKKAHAVTMWSSWAAG